MVIYYGGGGFTTRKEIGQYGSPLSVLEPFDVIRKKGVRPQEWWDRFFLDSGAFTVSQKGITIDIEEYIAFIKRWRKLIDVYAALDVVGDGEASYRNWKAMLRAGLDPLPVFHDGEPRWILEKYAQVTNYIGLGAVAFKSTKARLLFFDQVFSLFPDPSEIGFHGFGVLDEKLLLRYPWKSVDATTVLVQARYGGIFYPGYGPIRINPNVSPKDLRWKTELTEQIIRKYVEGLGFSYEEACRQDQIGTFTRCFISIRYFEDIAKRVPKKFSPVRKADPILAL